jgi:hypothetical protein
MRRSDIRGSLVHIPPIRVRITFSASADLYKIDYDHVVLGNALFKNLGDGKFVEASEAANMETFWPWGIATISTTTAMKTCICPGWVIPFPLAQRSHDEQR